MWRASPRLTVGSEPARVLVNGMNEQKKTKLPEFSVRVQQNLHFIACVALIQNQATEVHSWSCVVPHCP